MRGPPKSNGRVRNLIFPRVKKMRPLKTRRRRKKKKKMMTKTKQKKRGEEKSKRRRRGGKKSEECRNRKSVTSKIPPLFALPPAGGKGQVTAPCKPHVFFAWEEGLAVHLFF